MCFMEKVALKISHLCHLFHKVFELGLVFLLSKQSFIVLLSLPTTQCKSLNIYYFYQYSPSHMQNKSSNLYSHTHTNSVNQSHLNSQTPLEFKEVLPLKIAFTNWYLSIHPGSKLYLWNNVLLQSKFMLLGSRMQSDLSFGNASQFLLIETYSIKPFDLILLNR